MKYMVLKTIELHHPLISECLKELGGNSFENNISLEQLIVVS